MLLLVSDVLPWLRGPDDWRWALLPFPPFAALVPLLFVGAAYIGFVIWSDVQIVKQRQRIPWQLWLLLVLAIGIQYTTLFYRYDQPARLLFNLVASDSINGFYRVSAEITHLRDFLINYPWLMDQLPNHLTTHPPGNVLIFWLSGKLAAILPGSSQLVSSYNELGCMHPWVAQSPQTAVLGGVAAFLYPLGSLLAIFPLFLWTRNQYGAQTAWRAAAFYPLVPALMLNVGQTDQLYPLFAILSLYALQRAFAGDSNRWLYASGLCLSVATFLTLGVTAFLLTIGLCGLYYLYYLKQADWREMARVAAIFVAGFLTVWFLYFVFTGTNPIFIWIEGLTAHASIGRNYLPWQFFNLLDIVTFWGIPFLVVLLLRFLTKRSAGIDWFVIVVLITFFVLNLTGITRGEVARLWLFLLPLYVIISAESLSHLSKKNGLFAVVLSFVFAQLVIYAGVIDTPHPRVEELRITTQGASTALPQQGIEIGYGDQLNLIGYTSSQSLATSREQLDFRLFWDVSARPQRQYSVFTHLIDADSGELLAQNDKQFPYSRDWPTSCWEEGRNYSESFSIRPNQPLPDGNYILAAGFYEHATNVRPPVVQGAQVADGAAIVAEFQIGEGRVVEEEVDEVVSAEITPQPTQIAEAIKPTATATQTPTSPSPTVEPTILALLPTISPTDLPPTAVPPTTAPTTSPPTITPEPTWTPEPPPTPTFEPSPTTQPTATTEPEPTAEPTPEPPPCIDPVQPPPGEYPLVGLHASADAQITDWERCLFQQVRPSVIKVLTHHPPEHIRLLALSQPQATWIIRVQFKFEGRDVSGAQFAEWALADTQRTVNALAGRPVIIELHNEPNTTLEGWQHQWANGWEFNQWYLEALPTFRAAFPGVPIIYPGLSPGATVGGARQDSTEFLAQSAEALAASDGLGVHIYWSHDYSMDAALAVLDGYIAAAPGKPIWITETSFNRGGLSDEDRAAQYLQLVDRVRQRPAVRGVIFFVASASNPQFEPETWLNKGIGALVGAR